MPRYSGAMMKHVFLTMAIAAMAGMACGLPSALALDLNSFRAQHRLPPLTSSSTLALAAAEHARDLARRNRLDHKGFKQRLAPVASTAAENVLWGCETEDCAIKMWAKSANHRRNMLMKGVSAYGIASARADNGRKYWVMELGN